MVSVYVYCYYFHDFVVNLEKFNEKLRTPVGIYCLLIANMTAFSSLRYKKTENNSFWMILFGSVLFMISDSFLAYNKFAGINSKYMHFIVLLTYFSG